MKNSETNRLLEAEKKQLELLQEIVRKTMEEENLIINNLLNPQHEKLNKSQTLADKIAKFGGSWSFIIIFLTIILLWIVINTLLAIQFHFDPYPFILMNLVLSCIAALQAPIIMMSQNRQEEKDRKRAENDYLINLKAELEIRSLHQKMNLLLEEQIKLLFESQGKQLELLKRIENKLKPQVIINENTNSEANSLSDTSNS
ncbi:MAG: DUF1003 domain-containing protein [Saprospiraceae bacterium]|nr:DUF1003 domain-containing protein [Saprospiraceae bacterium]